MSFDINKDWDKSKVYFSPSGEIAAIFINNQWRQFYSSEGIADTFKDIERDAFEAGQQLEVPDTLYYGLKYTSFEDWKKRQLTS